MLDGSGKVIEAFRVRTTEPALSSRLAGFAPGRVVLEVGTHSPWVSRVVSRLGHEAVVAHNSSIFEEGYIYGAEYLSRIKPDLLMGGHSYVMNRPARFIERYRKWSIAMRDAFRELSSEEDYRTFYDPFWVRAQPYRVGLKRGEAAEIDLHVRNFHKRVQRHRIALALPPGLSAEPMVLEGQLPAQGRKPFKIRLRAEPGAAPGVRIVAFDVTLDGRRYGQRFDAIVEIR